MNEICVWIMFGWWGLDFNLYLCFVESMAWSVWFRVCLIERIWGILLWNFEIRQILVRIFFCGGKKKEKKEKEKTSIWNCRIWSIPGTTCLSDENLELHLFKKIKVPFGKSICRLYLSQNWFKYTFEGNRILLGFPLPYLYVASICFLLLLCCLVECLYLIEAFEPSCWRSAVRGSDRETAMMFHVCGAAETPFLCFVWFLLMICDRNYLFALFFSLEVDVFLMLQFLSY